ncbi:MAG: hypothetical protein ACE1Z4_01120, partial [Gammaproteobacteria bacterium]
LRRAQASPRCVIVPVVGTKAQNRERRHESLHDVGVLCTRRRAAVMSPQSVAVSSYISAGSSRLRGVTV